VETYDYGKLGIGFDFCPCTGLYYLYGTPKDKIKPECIVNLGLTVSQNKIHYMFRLRPTEGALKQNLAYGQEWKEGNSFKSLNIELAAGYELLNKRIFNIIPIASVGLLSFTTIPNNENELSTSTKTYLSWSLGTAFDLKLNMPIREKNRFPGYEYVVQYFNLRILTGISPTYFKVPFDMNGGLFYISASISGYFKGPKKIK
jgi:hypothetical protein